MAAASEAGAADARAARPAGAEGGHGKPFTPEKAREIIMSLQRPAVFCNMVYDWPARHWTAQYLAGVLQGKQIRFRMGLKSTDTVPQFEPACGYVDATVEEFLAWNSDQSDLCGPFKDHSHSKFWAYADYKYFVSLFEDKTDVFQDVMWSDFGFPGRNGQESTLWIGSLGANTPCHLDSYGCNLVFQVQGRKRWHLFPPEDMPFLYPTRIPYEESSVFSKVNVVNPDFKCFPQFQKARRHVVTLRPGQVLFVPRHWWHYVESIDPVTVSINSWIELEEDHLARVEEAITRMLVCALKTAENPHNTRAWLNPTEVEEISHEVNCHYLNGAVCAFLDHSRMSKAVKIQALRTPGENGKEIEHAYSQNIATAALEQATASPFGPDLVPVTPGSGEPPSERGGIFEDELGNKHEGHLGKVSPAKRQQERIKTGNVMAEQPSSHSPRAPQTVSTDDLLDCLVNPQVTRLVAQLLIRGKSL
uniref:HSPB1-associated protein 1 n=1 Tax=Jaculus jaculus TaxID=51337 RepID=UPI001E1B19E6|nr:HSPB1-associated protein 1 [Jaculus jaculus]